MDARYGIFPWYLHRTTARITPYVLLRQWKWRLAADSGKTVAREQDGAQAFGVRDISFFFVFLSSSSSFFLLLVFLPVTLFSKQTNKNKPQTTNDEPKSTVWNTIRYRARNMCGQDGRVLRIICLVGTVLVLILIGIVIGTTANKKSNAQLLRHPKHNGYEAFNWDDLKPNVQTAAVRAAQTNQHNTKETQYNTPHHQSSKRANKHCRRLFIVLSKFVLYHCCMYVFVDS